VGWQVVYLTGPPATGKSTLVSLAKQKLPALETFIYGEVLTEYVNRNANTKLAQPDIRRESSRVISPEDVEAADHMLLELVRRKRDTAHVMIDSHPVTKEGYGFRVTPFSLRLLEAIRPTMVVCLYAHSAVVRKRIGNDAQGRPEVSRFESDYHCCLQASVALTYSIHLGVPMYCYDSDRPADELADALVERIRSASSAG